MAQQINLFSPILLTPKRYFSALAMAQALALFGVGLVGLCAWTVSSSSTLQRDLQSATQLNQAEHLRLTAVLAGQPAATAGSATATQQELAQAEKQLAGRHRLLADLKRGLASEGHSHSAWLRLLAQTVPAPVWLTEVRLVEGRVELAGMTQQPEALRPWLAKLSAHPLAGGLPFAAVRLEHSEAQGGAELWAFHVAGGGPAGAQR